MNWSGGQVTRDVRMTDTEWQLARQVCTQRQLQVLDLWRRGAGTRRIAAALGIDRSTVKGHLEAGTRRVEDALRAMLDQAA